MTARPVPRSDSDPDGDPDGSPTEAGAARKRRAARVLFALAGLGLVLYMLNIAAGMAAVKLGWKLQRFGDLWEFLTVLVTMILFVAGLLVTERKRPEEPH
jgi:hypothetical protein